MSSFLTGSHVYGTPREQSDIDLVVLVTEDECRGLIGQADLDCGRPNPSSNDFDVSLRFGKLNLIVLTDQEKFELWRKATDALKDRKPVTRREAVDYHREHVDAELCMRRCRIQQIESAVE